MASELLKTGQYEQVAAILQARWTASDQTEDAVLGHLLDAARRICLACKQCRAAVEWHSRALEEAEQRERELGQQLFTILDLIAEGQIPQIPVEQERSFRAFPADVSPPERAYLRSAEHRGLWQRIQGWLRRKYALVPKQEQLRTSAEPPTLPPAEPVEVSTIPPREPEREVSGENQKGKGLAPPSLMIYCLGSFRVYQDDQLITDWPSGKGKAIFKYMVANRDCPVPKDILMDLLWRDADPEAARNNLNVAMYGLRQALRAVRPASAHILFQDDHYLLNPAVAVWVDSEEFVRHYEAGQSLEKRGKLTEAMKEYETAEGLYQGDFLEEDLYEDWPMLRREGLKDSYLVILDRLSRRYLEEKRYAACIHLCQRILAKDDCREDAHRRLMRCYSRQGQRNLALRQYHLCAETLARVLDVSPMQETVALYRQIHSGEAV